MVQDTNTTAERELLKTIEGSASLQKKVKSIGAGSVVNALFDRVNALFLQIKKAGEGKKLNLKTLNMVFIGILILLVLSSGVTVFAGVQRLGKIPRFDISQLRPATIEGASIELPVESFEHYSDIVMERNIFLAFQEKETAQEVGPKVSRINDMVENLQVVGISESESSSGEKERYAMVEDLKTELTYFLNEGDTILNVMVKQIKENSLVLEYQQETIELR